jgi:hypothetical protein
MELLLLVLALLLIDVAAYFWGADTRPVRR